MVTNFSTVDFFLFIVFFFFYSSVSLSSSLSLSSLSPSSSSPSSYLSVMERTKIFSSSSVVVSLLSIATSVKHGGRSTALCCFQSRYFFDLTRSLAEARSRTWYCWRPWQNRCWRQSKQHKVILVILTGKTPQRNLPGISPQRHVHERQLYFAWRGTVD